MKHFILPENFTGEELTINRGKNFHYLSHVLRLHEGDTLNCVDNSGRPYRLIILTVDKKHMRLKPLNDDGPSVIADSKELKTLSINLYQCIPKGKKMDLIIRQAIEMGVLSITPVVSRYTVPVFKSGTKLENKLKRWKRIAKEAVQQSGALKMPRINIPILLKDIRAITAADPSDTLIFFHPDPNNKTTLHKILYGNVNGIGLMIGPEGGFSNDEIALLKSYGFYSAYLGDTILRTETAAIYAIAAVKMITLERNSWKIRDELETEYETS